MYRQNGRKNDSREVTLVRVRPHDSRTCRSGRRGSAKRKVLLLILIISAILACVETARFLLRDSGGEEAFPAAARDIKDIKDISDIPDISKLPDTSDTPESVTREPEPVREPLPKEKAVVLTEEEEHPPRVAIDPGHGGEDEGSGMGGVLEKEVNLEIALLLETRLQELGYETVLIRRDNETKMTPEERVRCAEEAGATLYISIHQNSCEGENAASASGIETWYCGDTEGSRRLAQLVHKGAVGKTGARDRELKETGELYVTRETSMPSCLIETGFLTNEEERAAVASPEYQKKLAEGIAQGVDCYFNPKTMYLTFDDGPSSENTAIVLDILKAYNIKATFFLVGENVERYPETAKRIAEEGHTIGIHCYSHDYKELYKSVDAYLEDFQKAYDVILETTGVEAQLFRFPGGSINSYNKKVYKDIAAEMTERGFIYFDWNACVEDAVKYPTTPRQLVQNGVKSTLGRKKVVMLCHDVIYNTTQCLEELIDSLPEYRMEPLTPEVSPVQF